MRRPVEVDDYLKMQIKADMTDVTINLGNKGITLKIADNSGKHVGTLQVGQATALWMKGKKRPQNGKKISISKLIDLLDEAD